AFALPPTHVRQLHVNAGLDKEYRDGELRLSLVLDSGNVAEKDLSLALKLQDPAGKLVKQSLLASVSTTARGERDALFQDAVEPFAGRQGVGGVAPVAQ